MKLTRNQKIYASVLGVALGALLIDQTLLAPRDASGGTGPAVAGSIVPPLHRTITVPTTVEIPERRLAARLRVYAETQDLDPAGVDDPFAIPAHWRPAQDGRPVPTGNLSSAEHFASKHRLNAVMANGDGGYAIVDGRRLRLGEELDGFRLVAVRPRSILLRANDVEVELTLTD